MKYLRLSILTLILAIALASLTSCNVSAVDLTQDVYLVQGNFAFSMAPYSWTCYNDSSCPSWSSGVYQRSFASFGANIFDISISIPNRTYTSGDWLVFDFYFFHSNTAANHSIFDGIRYEGSNYLDVVDVQVEQLTDNSAHATVYTRVYNTFTDSNLRFTGNVIMFQLQSAANAQYKAEVDAGTLTIWHERNVSDYSSALQSIQNSINSQSNSLNSINSGIQSLNDSMDGVADQEERVADVAEDEYNKTIEDEATASAGAGGFSFNFALPNPFGIFQVSDGCVSTPTIDSWLHLEGDWQSPHCPIIPASVRNILTPVVTLIVTLATLLVVIRWVSSSAVDVAGNSVALNDKPQKGGK